jgi:Predicted NTPase (NACHT family)
MGNIESAQQPTPPAPEQGSKATYTTETQHAQGTTIGQGNTTNNFFADNMHVHLSKQTEGDRSVVVEVVPSDEGLAERYTMRLQHDPKLNMLDTVSRYHPVTLSDLYVPVRLQKSMPLHTLPLAEKRKDAQDPLEILQKVRHKQEQSNLAAIEPAQALQQYHRCVAVGDPGAGKTTLLKQLVKQALQTEAQNLPALPIILNLHEAALAGAHDLLTYALQSWEQNYGLSQVHMEPFIQRQLEDGQALFLLDALDEASIGQTMGEANTSYRRIVTAIEQLSTSFPRTPIMVTARRAGYFSHKALSGFSTFEVLDFLPKDIRRFIMNWFAQDNIEQSAIQGQQLINELQNTPRIYALAANPLLLSLIVLTYEKNRRQLPHSRTDLYTQCVAMLLQDWDEARQIERFHTLSTEEHKQLLVSIAVHFHQRRQRYFTTLQLLQQISCHKGLSIEESKAILKEITGDAGLLREQAEDNYSFLHLTLQEYFTALHFTSASTDIYSHLGDPWWDEVTLLLVPQLADAGPLLGHLYTEARQKEDIFASKLVLAGHCLATRPRLRTRAELATEIPQWLCYQLEHSPYTITRQNCAEALAEIGREQPQSTDYDTNQQLLTVLAKRDATLQLLVLQAIHKAGARALAGPLLALVNAGTFAQLYSMFTQVDVIDLLEATLSRLCDDTLLPELYASFKAAAANEKMRKKLGINPAAIIAHVKGKEVTQHLLNWHADPEYSATDGWLAIALGYTGDPTILPLLIEGLQCIEKDSLPSTADWNAGCMMGLLVHGDESIPSRLIELLNNDKLISIIHFDIAACLTSIAEPSLQDRLQEALNQPWFEDDERSKSLLVYTLFKIGRRELRDALIQRYIVPPLEDSIPFRLSSHLYNAIKIELLKAIADTHYTQARPQLQRLLADPVAKQCRTLYATLGMLEDGLILPDLQTILAEISEDDQIHYQLENEEDVDDTVKYCIDALLMVSPPEHIIHLFAHRDLQAGLRVFIAQRLRQSNRSFDDNFFLQLAELLGQHAMFDKVRQQIAGIIAQHASGRDIAQKLMEQLPSSNIADDIHDALYHVCRRSGVTVREDRVASGKYRLVGHSYR